MNKCVFVILFLSLVLVASSQESDTATKAGGVSDKYNLIISKAATAVSNQNFEEAKALYNEALALKPNDPFASGMIINVNNSIKALEVIRQRNSDLKRKADINILLKQAESEVSAKNYDSAKKHYNEVLALNPIKSQEEFAKQRIRAIDFALSGSAQSTATNNVSSANNNTIKIDSPASSVKKETKNINTIIAIKPVVEPAKKAEKEVRIEKDTIRRTAPSNQNAYLNSSVAKKESSQVERKPADTANKSKIGIVEAGTMDKPKNDNQTAKAKIDSLIENAIKAINRENWQTALNLYNEVLTLHPTAVQEKAINSEIIEIRRNLDKAKLKSGESNAAKTESPAQKSTTLPNDKAVSKTAIPKITTSKTRDSASTRNKNIAVSANNGDLITSMPSTARDTTTVSINQTLATSVQDTDKEDVDFSKKIATQPSLFHLTDINNQVRLTCQGISTNGKNTFLKFVIQNQRTDSAFSIGSLQMSYIQNSGKLNKLNVRNISDSRVVLPKKELPIVIVTENQPTIEPNEVFIFEMEDQSQSTRLMINISTDNFVGKNGAGRAF